MTHVPRDRHATLFASLGVAVCATAFYLLHAGQRNNSVLLLAIMMAWVQLPYVAMLLLTIRLRQPMPTLYGALVCLALLAYSADYVKPLSAHRAFAFVVIPAALWILLIASQVGSWAVRRNSTAATK